MLLNPGLKKVRLTQEYDLFLANCQHYWDLLYINAIEDWKSHCKVSVCWIEEMWSAVMPGYKQWLHALNQFDYVFVSFRGTVAPLSRLIDRPCFWLPSAVDALRFAPGTNPPNRAIDVYSIGRRWEGVHQALLQLARSRGMFYIHDTFQNTADMDVQDHRQHRDLFASRAKRSRYFVVAPAKMDALDHTRGQVEIGYRYYEGAGAGAVMIGQSPKSDTFTGMFGWPDVVVEIKPDGSDVTKILDDLDSDPARVREIGARNASNALLHHDWSYRWTQLLQTANLAAPSGMAARGSHLRALAEAAYPSAHSGRDKDMAVPVV